MCAIKYFFLLSNPEKQIGVKRKTDAEFIGNL